MEQEIVWLLESYPACRTSTNRLLMGYWRLVDMDKCGRKKFDDLTPAETIAREHRKILAKRPDLHASTYERSRNEQDLFTLVNATFPGTAQV